MNLTIAGLHHVTAITGDAQGNIDFYSGVLGLRLVKLTVNFDDPGSYHLYYGNPRGEPGTILTFFAWPGAYRGRVGLPQVTAIAWGANAAAMDYWLDRLRDHHVKVQTEVTRFGQRVLEFTDPEGLPLEIMATEETVGATWEGSPVPAAQALLGFHGVTLSEEGYEKTAGLLTEVMGYQAMGSEGNHFRYRAGPGPGMGALVDVRCLPGARHGNMGAGVVHHVAFRTPDEGQQVMWRERLVAKGLNVTPVIDREYFRSIYFREPGGVLFEIATVPPGFMIDEPLEQLGTRLMLPPWLEGSRREIERLLPRVRLPGVVGAGAR